VTLPATFPELESLSYEQLRKVRDDEGERQVGAFRIMINGNWRSIERTYLFTIFSSHLISKALLPKNDPLKQLNSRLRSLKIGTVNQASMNLEQVRRAIVGHERRSGPRISTL